MPAIVATLLFTSALLTLFGIVVAIGAAAHRNGVFRLSHKQFRISAPMTGRLFDDDADSRRIEHDLDAIRTRFENHPVWPSPGAMGERR